MKWLLLVAAMGMVSALLAMRKADPGAGTSPSIGDAARGPALIRYYGCSSCHTIPGVSGATATVGPSLEKMGRRSYVGGVLRNTPEHMVRWIKNPQAVDPLTAMPNLRVSDGDARDIASYLYTLR